MHSLRVLHSAALCVLSATLAFSQPPASIQGFGSAAVNTPTKITVNLSFTGLSTTPAFSLAYGIDFAAATPSCVLAATTTCTVQVTFKPLSPGLRQDALRAKGQSGNVLANVFLHGIGLAPQLLLYPGIISTFAGNGSWAYVDNANPARASFRNPQGLAIDPVGNVLIADSVNQVIRKVSAAGGAVTTIAGNANADYKGDGGLATSASLNSPTAVALDAAGNLYIADQGNNVIREVDAVTGIITTVAGGSTIASQPDQIGDGGPATSAILNGPQSIAIDSSGNIFIADAYHQLVRKVNASTGIITVVAGGGTAIGTDGFGDGGLAISAQLSNQLNLALDSTGTLYIADTGDCLIRLVNNSSGVISAVAGNGACGYSGDGNVATSASLNSPNGIYVDPAGNIYIADFGNNVVRQVSAATGRITTLIGNGTNGYVGDGNIPSAASLANPMAVVLDSIGSVYVADYVNNVIRKVSFAPVPMSFPNETVGAASPAQTVVAFNNGNETLNFSNLSFAASFSQQSSGVVDCNLHSTVLPGAGCTVAALFAPANVGTLSGSLIFSTNSLNGAPSSKIVPLSGTAIAGSGPKATLSAAGLTFASRNEGTVSPAQTVTLSNTGGSAFNIYTIWLSGAQAVDFRLTTTCGSTLAASASCGISVAFAPTSAGTRSAALAINDSVAGSPQTVALIGGGVAGTVSSNPASLSFIQPVNSTSAAQTVVLSNTGTIPVAIGSLWVSGPNSTEFNISTTCAPSLAVGASCNASIGFTPGATGSRTAMLSVSDDASGSPQTVALSGNGTAPGILASFNQAALNFSQNIGSTSAPQTVILTNVGAAPLNIFGASLAGQNAADFQLSTACSSALAPGASCNTSITFTPGALGSRTAAFTISDNAAGSPQVVSISGTGTAVPPGVLSLSNAGLSFTQTVGSVSPSQTIVFTNAGPVPVNIAGVALSGANSADFSITTDCGSVLPVSANCTATLSFAPSVVGSLTAAVILSDDAAGAPHSVALSGTGTAVAVVSAGLRFLPVTPCRVADTRGVNGPFGGPILTGGKSRDFTIPAGACGIPSTAKAYSLNFTVIPSGILGFLSVWPSGQAQPVVSLLNSDGRVKANAAIVPASASGGVAVYASNNSQVIIDVNGYFVPADDTSALAFYPLTPCRIFDSRSASTGGPSLTGGQAREVDVLSSPCNVSSAAQAYSLNFTAVPKAPLGYLATWPFGQSQPVVSTLNAPTGAVTANAAIVPVGDAGKISVYTSSNADVIIDINGYFGPPAAGALSLFNLTPCRVLDTRGVGSGAPFNGTLPISVSGSSCQVPATAQAYVLNATVVPSRPLGFLSLWPNGAPQAVVSTLNASDAAVTSDAAIVPTTNGSVNAYASNPTQLILDIAAYFAP